MPTILPVGFRRLLGNFSYAVDGIELAYERLRETALMYELPASDARVSGDNWTARSRLCLLIDAWSLIEHVSRVRKLVSQIPWSSGSPGADLNSFIRETKPATLIRNRLNELNGAVGKDAALVDGQSINGTVDWIDTRTAGSVIRYVVSAGPSADAERLLTQVPAQSEVVGGVAEFRLSVEDQEADLDRLRDAASRFAGLLETSLAGTVRDAVVAEAKKRETSTLQLCASSMGDVTAAVRFEPRSVEERHLSPGFHRTSAEVPPDTFVIKE